MRLHVQNSEEDRPLLVRLCSNQCHPGDLLEICIGDNDSDLTFSTVPLIMTLIRSNGTRVSLETASLNMDGGASVLSGSLYTFPACLIWILKIGILQLFQRQQTTLIVMVRVERNACNVAGRVRCATRTL